MIISPTYMEAGAAQSHAAESVGAELSPLRIVLFACGRLGFEAASALRRLPEVAELVVVHAPYQTKQRTGLDRLRHLVRYNSPTRLLATAANRAVSSSWGRRKDDDPLVHDEGVISVADFHDDDCIRAVTEFSPDLGVIVGTYILKPEIFSIPRLGSINLHTGRAPHYRGAAPAFWELFNGEERVGITIHRVAEQVDAGGILRQETFPFDTAPSGNPLSYIEEYRRTVLRPNGIRLLAETVSAIARGTIQEQPQDDTKARTYRMPDWKQVKEMKRRVARRRRSHTTRRVKAAIGWLAFRTGLHRRLLKNRALIVLFHRVDDAYAGNPISCTRAEFEQYCRFFGRHFDVVSLSDLVERVRNRRDLSGKLVITFDDGYADNVEAGRVLREMGLPACFYIATGFIGTDVDGWWDVEQGLGSKWMTWDDVRQLAAWGFELGAHTENHVDLGEVSGSAATSEVEGSKLTLERELKSEVLHFSFPFGRKENITADNLRMIEAAGFESCTSAFGGAVDHGSNVFDLQRVPVSPWHISPWQLAYELLFEHTRIESPVSSSSPSGPRTIL